MIELGKKAIDKITGFSGIITSRVQYLTGCDQYGITPKMQKKDTEVKRTEYFDEGRIEVLGEGIKPAKVAAPARGGPNRDAPSK